MSAQKGASITAVPESAPSLTNTEAKVFSPRTSLGDATTSNEILSVQAASGDKRGTDVSPVNCVQLKRKFEVQDAQQIKAPGRLARKRIRDAKHKARSGNFYGNL